MKKLLQSLFILLCIASSAMAQDRTITGTVTDKEDGRPLPGVTVRIKGAKGGTQTGGNGSYSLKVPSSGTAIEFSYLGYISQSRTITSNVINVILDADSKSLTEVVVTGVGVATERKKVAIAIESVGAKDLPRAPTGSIDQALIGKIAGAQISSTSGQPGQQAAIILRGLNSLTTSQPMILVDGVAINSGGSTNGSGTNMSSRLSDLDLSNVERVEVIQGAAAGTIYGAQGANGVIQIFMKKGKKGQAPAITVSSRLALDNAIRGKLTYANNHFFNTDAEGYIISGAGTKIVQAPNGEWGKPGIPTVTGTTVSNKPYKETVYDHADQLFKKDVITENTNINISGGGEKMDYSLSVSNLSQGSLVFGRLNRYNASANIGGELFKNFTVRSSTQVINSDNGTGGITGANNIYSGLGSALSARRYWDLKYKDADGNSVADPEKQNSVNPFYTQQFRDYNAQTTRIIQNFNLNYKFDKFLQLDYKYGIDNTRYDFKDFIKYQVDVKTPGPGLDPRNGRLTLDRDKETIQNSLLTAFIKTDFEKDFNSSLPIQTSTQLAFDWRKRKYQNVTAVGTGFASFPPYNLSTAATQSNSELSEDFVTYGYLINQRLDYGALFGVSGGVRIDYSSAFGAGSKPFTFPRADAYFNIGDLLKSKIIPQFKLRAAYGQAGIQPGPYDRFITLNAGNIGTASYLALKSRANNPDLKVQVSKEFEFGTDLNLNLGNDKWFSTVNLNATYWKRTSEDVIYNLDVAPSSGSSEIIDNAITLKGNGFQFSLDAEILKSKNLNWTFGARFAHQKSMVDKISNGQPISLGSGGGGQFVLQEGRTVGAFYGYAPLSSIGQTDKNGARIIPVADEGLYEVVNGMVVNKTTKAVKFTPENVPIGDPTPKFNMSFINTFNIYKNLTVGFQLDWTYGNDIYNQTKQWLFRDFLHSDFDKEITVNGQKGAYVAYYNSLYNTNNNNAYFVEKGSFLRLRDVTLSYNFSDLVKLKFFRSLELSVTGRNLFTITKYTGMDPEAAANFNDPLRRGLDLYSFPNVRTIQFGLTVGL